MAFSFVKKSFLNAYVQLTYYNGSSSVGCIPLGSVNPYNISTERVDAISEALGNCLRNWTPTFSGDISKAQIIAIKLVQGYKISFTPDPITPYIFDLNCGWVGTGNGLWTYENPTNSFSDVYKVQAGVKYWLTLGDVVGTRFRVMFSTVDVSTATENVTGVPVNKSNYNNPVAHQNIYYTPTADGYIIVQKDNVGSAGIKTYLYYAKDLT